MCVLHESLLVIAHSPRRSDHQRLWRSSPWGRFDSIQSDFFFPWQRYGKSCDSLRAVWISILITITNIAITRSHLWKRNDLKKWVILKNSSFSFHFKRENTFVFSCAVFFQIIKTLSDGNLHQINIFRIRPVTEACASLSWERATMSPSSTTISWTKNSVAIPDPKEKMKRRYKCLIPWKWTSISWILRYATAYSWTLLKILVGVYSG